MHLHRSSLGLSALLALALAAPLPASAQTTKAPKAPAKTSTAATKDEVNAATTAMGANGLKVQGDALGLGPVLSEKQGASAQLIPSSSGAATTVIDLASTVSLTRVLLEVGQTPGRLVMVGMTETGEQVDLSTESGVKKLIADRRLDGTESVIALDVSQLAVKAVMIYWVPDEPGTPLVLNKVGLFTKDAITPAAPTGETAVPPPPVVPTPEVVEAIVAVVQETRQAALAAGTPAAPTTGVTPAAPPTPLPEPIPPESRATST